MEHSASISAIAEVIQLAVAPVFLITGIAGLLSVLVNRLHRIIDRARLIDARVAGAVSDERQARLLDEANLLWWRIRTINWAIRLSIGAALLICLVVVCLFVGDVTMFPLGGLIAWLFIGAMLLMISGLMLLLIEMSISTRRMRQGLEHLLSDQAPTPDA